ncbi:cyclodeaminase [Halobacillus halophilus]|uniref:Ornithine cyclodeaminase n=1 Tax=Halobacillus halophilus (strain ATCC 35676 / DSM 2266 / JCM 20832 / KCTC 3685 / LMG 17431 / NBRC 102448 / NCIMB 2269) TaxID=866895 RepID=I0JSY1_HALH3|nr:cyclodeaminase [Halobacillus halophilus]ASF41174.1 cyclodeaminase [Halobacillus halophilus]CCG47253.1 ornithine cyclodeaminase [Halobacillus halophilus DSM 2266]
MTIIQLFHRSEIKHVVRLDKKVVDLVEDGFNALSDNKVQMPPIMRIDVPEHNGEVDIKSAYIRGYDSFAIKLSSGFFNNPQMGLPSANGLMILLSAETGRPMAILADQGLLTDLRTAAAGAVAARHLSRQDSRTAGIIGTGAQARLQLEALSLVRPIERVLVYGRDIKKADAYKEDIEERLSLPVEVCAHPQEVAENSDIVVTTTPSSEPLIKGEWLQPGVHVTAMGSDAEHKQELETSVLVRADQLVCDVKAQSVRLGELRNGQQETVDRAFELGEITSGRKQGRQSPDEVTVCDLTGTGVQDTVIARHVYSLLVPQEEIINGKS